MSGNNEKIAAANVKRQYTPTPWRRTPSLTVFCGLSDIAHATGVAGPATVANWRSRLSGFPAPRAGGKFDLVEVVEWMRDHGPRGTDVRDIPVRKVWPHFVAAYHDAAQKPSADSRATMVALVLLRHSLLRTTLVPEAPLQWQGIVRAALEQHHADAPMWVPFADQLRLAASDLEAADPRLRGLLVEQLTVHGSDAVHLMDLVDLLDRFEDHKDVGALDAVLDLDPERSRSTRSSGRRLAALAVGLARLEPGHTLLDPAVGEGTVLAHAHRRLGGEVRLLGQEISSAVWATARSRLLVTGVDADLGERPADSLRDDLHPGVRADAVVIDPPLGEGAPALDRWIEYGLGHLAPGGRLVVVLPMHEFVPVRTARRRPSERMRTLLRGLLADDLVESILVVPARLRGDIVGPSMIVALRLGSRKPVEIGGVDLDSAKLWLGNRVGEISDVIRSNGVVAAAQGQPGMFADSVPTHRVFDVLESIAATRSKPMPDSAMGRFGMSVDEAVLDALMEPPRSAPSTPSTPSTPPSPLEELAGRLSEVSREASQQRNELARLRDQHSLLRAGVRGLIEQIVRQREAIDPAAFRELSYDIDRLQRELG